MKYQISNNPMKQPLKQRIEKDVERKTSNNNIFGVKCLASNLRPSLVVCVYPNIGFCICLVLWKKCLVLLGFLGVSLSLWSFLLNLLMLYVLHSILYVTIVDRTGSYLFVVLMLFLLCARLVCLLGDMCCLGLRFFQQ